jgi:hypothetical protein
LIPKSKILHYIAAAEDIPKTDYVLFRHKGLGHPNGVIECESISSVEHPGTRAAEKKNVGLWEKPTSLNTRLGLLNDCC